MVQVSVLITCLGIEGARIYDSFVFADQADKLKILPVLREFDGHFRPQKSETFERFKFVTRRQAVDEPFDKFLLALKGLISSCNYDTHVTRCCSIRLLLASSITALVNNCCLSQPYI